MTASITLKKEDYLTYVLFTSSKSKRVKKNRLISRLILIIGCLIGAFIGYQKEDIFIEYYFLAAGVGMLLFYPRYQRWYYKRHYAKQVSETRKDCFNEICKLEITTEQIWTVDDSSEMKFKTADMLEINEIADYFFLKVKGGSSLMLPKAEFDYKSLLELLTDISKKYSIPMNRELGWKWR